MVSKWIKAERHTWGLSASLTFFDKVNLYCGTSESFGIGIAASFYDRSLTFRILHLYAGIEVYYKD